MNFIEAVKEMINGKEVKRIDGTVFMSLDDCENVKFKRDAISCRNILATDWEVVEKKETLSDNIMDGRYGDVIAVDSVKEALKEFIKKAGLNEYPIIILKEIFGEELI